MAIAEGIADVEEAAELGARLLEAREAIRQADSAMYAAKRRRRSLQLLRR